jgi:Neuraminidase (sialidase)
MATWMSDDSALDAIQTSNDILVARSTDNGTNWSVPKRLYGTGETELGNGFFPQLATDGGRSWFVVWDAIDSIDGRFGKDSEILMVRSTDRGRTWTTPAALNMNATSDKRGDRSPQLATDGQGNWIAAWLS